MTAAIEIKKEYSLAEFLEWVRQYGLDDQQYELINGEIVERDPEREAGPSGRHGEVMNILGSELRYFAKAEKLARVFTDAACTLSINVNLDLETAANEAASSNISSITGKGKRRTKKANLTKASYVIPDVSLFLASTQLPTKFNGPIPALPELVAEINSPTDTTERIHDKIEIYRKAGVRLIWSIFLLDEYVLAYRMGQPDKQYLGLDDELDGGEVLPGFQLRVRQLFDQ